MCITLNEKLYKRIIVSIILSIIILNLSLSSILGANYVYNEKKSSSSSISTSAPSPVFNFQSKSQVLMEPITGNVIYASNENEKILPASVTKVMTLLLTMEAIDNGKLSYEDKITCSANASHMGGSQIWFKENEQLSVDEALKAICVVSANDVTLAMAEHLAGSESNFVKLMNEKAKELNMQNTNFMNSHGIDEENHYTSAMDIAIMSRELINNHPDILKYTSIWMDTLRDGKFALSSTNKLIRFYEGATGLKTGSTSKALFNLSATATRGNTTFLAVVCTAPTSDIRLNEVKQLLDYGFSNYEVQNIKEKDSVIDSIKINKNVNKQFDVITESNISLLFEKGMKVDIDMNISYNDNLLAPINKETTIGKVQIINKSTKEPIAETEIFLKEDVLRSSYKDYLIEMIKQISNM